MQQSARSSPVLAAALLPLATMGLHRHGRCQDHQDRDREESAGVRRRDLRRGRSLRAARRHRLWRDRPARSAQRDHHGHRARAAQRPRHGRVFDGHLHPQAGRHEQGQPHAALRGRQSRAQEPAGPQHRRRRRQGRATASWSARATRWPGAAGRATSRPASGSRCRSRPIPTARRSPAGCAPNTSSTAASIDGRTSPRRPPTRP